MLQLFPQRESVYGQVQNSMLTRYSLQYAYCALMTYCICQDTAQNNVSQNAMTTTGHSVSILFFFCMEGHWGQKCIEHKVDCINMLILSISIHQQTQQPMKLLCFLFAYMTHVSTQCLYFHVKHHIYVTIHKSNRFNKQTVFQHT